MGILHTAFWINCELQLGFILQLVVVCQVLNFVFVHVCPFHTQDSRVYSLATFSENPERLTFPSWTPAVIHSSKLRSQDRSVPLQLTTYSRLCLLSPSTHIILTRQYRRRALPQMLAYSDMSTKSVYILM